MMRSTVLFVVSAWLAVSMTVSAQSTALFGGSFTPIGIPDGSSTCGGAQTAPGVTATVHVASGLPLVSTFKVHFGISHAWYNDVELVLAHNGVSVTMIVSNQVSCSEGSDLIGTFVLSDAAPLTLNAAAVAASGAIAPGEYGPDNALTPFLGLDPTGTWTLTAYDRESIVTGTLSGFWIEVNLSGSWYGLNQPLGSGTPLYIQHFGGTPGAIYLHSAVEGNGNNPAGWFYGLDITQQLIVEQIGFGAPFWGLLDSSGAYVGTDMTLPPNFVLSTVALEIDPITLNVSWVSLPLTVTVL